MEKKPKKTRLGLRLLRSRVEVRGMNELDRRTGAARELLAWRTALITDLGGEELISAQEKTLVELASRLKLILDHADAFILSLPSLINRKKKALIPIVAQRSQLAGELRDTLRQLGLKRVPKPVPTLAEYLASQQESGPVVAEEAAPDKPHEAQEGETKPDAEN
jgi:hypothetical protein